MTNILQLELYQYIENHNMPCELQDDGVVLYLAPYGRSTCEAHYIETYRQARAALGYNSLRRA